MRAFLDNDTLAKLPLFNLLDPFEDILNASECSRHYLDTFPFRYQLNDDAKGLKKCHTLEALNALRKFVAMHQAVPLIEASPLYRDMANIPGLDAGELRLVVAAMHHDDAIIFTGDKRFLRTLAGESRLSAQKTKLHGRIVAFEQVVRGLMLQLPFEDLKARVLPGLAHDTAMRAIFGSGSQSTPDSVADALNAYVSDVNQQAGALLISQWPPTGS